MNTVRRFVRRLLGGAPRPAPLPAAAWFEYPDADRRIDDLATAPSDRAVLESWVQHGYAIVEGVVPHDLIDRMLADLDRVFEADDVLDGMVFHDLVLPDGHRATTSQPELAGLGRAVRVSARDRSSWRTHGFFQYSSAAEEIRQLPELRRIASMILGVDSRAPYSINFHNGSTQALHQDAAVFHLGVPNMICGAWIACEDIVEEAGPLVYYPGSHRLPLFAGFPSYPQTNLRTADGETAAAYRTHVEAESGDFERHAFLARKGDVLFWHGMLIHGGETHRDPEATRQSYVLHFIPDGADVADQVTGPVNW